MTPPKHFELTNWGSESWTDSSDFIGSFIFGVQYAKKNWSYLSFEYILDIWFWKLSVIPRYIRPRVIALLFTYKKTILYLNSFMTSKIFRKSVA